MSKYRSEAELIAEIERCKIELRKPGLPPIDRAWKEAELRGYVRKLVKLQMEGMI